MDICPGRSCRGGLAQGRPVTQPGIGGRQGAIGAERLEARPARQGDRRGARRSRRCAGPGRGGRCCSRRRPARQRRGCAHPARPGDTGPARGSARTARLGAPAKIPIEPEARRIPGECPHRSRTNQPHHRVRATPVPRPANPARSWPAAISATPKDAKRTRCPQKTWETIPVLSTTAQAFPDRRDADRRARGRSSQAWP
jgi:hypothetical protein